MDLRFYYGFQLYIHIPGCLQERHSIFFAGALQVMSGVRFHQSSASFGLYRAQSLADPHNPIVPLQKGE